MRIYVAGKLCNEQERKLLDKVNKICEDGGFETFLPHRDCGIVAFKEELEKAFQDDKKALDECDFVVAVLDDRPGSGTCWEIGYAYCLGKKIIGIKTDKTSENSIPELSAMIIKSVDICESFGELREKLKRMKD